MTDSVNLSEEQTAATLQYLEAELANLNEAYADAIRSMIRMEDIGWKPLTGFSLEEQYDIEDLKDIAEKLREWSDTNPLLIRGNEVRCSYLFGDGYKIGTVGADTKISVRAQNDIDDPINQAAIFSPEALAANEKARYTDGQVFAVFDKARRKFNIVPFRQIEDALFNPDDPGEVWMYLRTQKKRMYSAESGMFRMEDESVWIPVDTWKPESDIRKLRKIGKHRIEWGKVIVDSRVNRKAGETWGLPDAFGAAPWALAYSSYMRDGSKVLAALAEWVWQVKPKKKQSGAQVGATVRSSDGPAKTLVSDMEIAALPKANTVDLSEGRPLAAQVASALGISVILLLSDSGDSGSFAAADTLTDPTVRTMKQRRALNTQFLVRCLKLLGITDPMILWPKMAQDPDHRAIQTIVAAIATGGFHPDEWRERVAEIAGFTLEHEEVPDGYMLPNNIKTVRANKAQTASPMAQATGQGGASQDTAKPSYGDNSLRDDVDG